MLFTQFFEVSFLALEKLPNKHYDLVFIRFNTNLILMTVQSLKEAVKKLSTQERILFVQYVLDTIAADTPEEADTELSEVWKTELNARSAAYKKGAAKTRSWDEIKNRLINSH